MNRKILSLVRVMLRNSTGLGIKDGKRSTQIFLIVMLALTVPFMLIGIVALFSSLIGAFMQIGQAGLVLKLGIGINSAIIFIFGIFYVMSSFYFSSDVEYLLPLPLKPWEIVSAKLIVVIIYEFIVTGVLYLPLLFTYGIRLGMGPLYYVYGLIVFVLLPIVPLALASFLVMLIMRFTNLKRHKDFLKVLAGMLGLFVGLGINMLLQNVSTDLSPEALLEMLESGSNSLVNVIPDIFPAAGWASQALVYSSSLKGLLNLILFVGVTLGAYGLITAFGQVIYLKGAVGLSEAGSSRRNKAIGQVVEKSRSRSALLSYCLVEIRLLVRTPIYFLNCVVMNFLWPLFLLIPLLTSGDQAMAFDEITRVISNPENAGIVLAAAFAMAVFMGASNGISSSAMSREGGNIYVKKYLPVSYIVQLNAKLLSAMLIGFAAILVLVLLCIILFKMPLFLGLLMLITSPLALLFVSLTGLMIDLVNPNFTWDNEQKAVKQNINVFFNVIIGMIMAPLVIVPTIIIKWTLASTLAILCIGFLVLDILMYSILATRGVKIFSSI